MLPGSMTMHLRCPGGGALGCRLSLKKVPRNMRVLYVWFMVNSGEPCKGSIPGERLWV